MESNNTAQPSFSKNIDFEWYIRFNEKSNATAVELVKDYQDAIISRFGIPIEVKVVLCCVGIILNSLNVWVFTRKSMSSSINVLLAAFEFFSIIIFLTSLRQAFEYYDTGNYLLGPVWLVSTWIYITLGLGSIIASNWIVVTIGIWRCLAVASSLKAAVRLTKRRAKLLVSLIFTVSILWVIGHLSLLSFDTKNVKASQNDSRNVTIYYLKPTKTYLKYHLVLVYEYILLFAILPMIILIISTTYIIRVLSRAVDNRRVITQSKTLNNAADIQKERKLSIMLVVILITFIFSYSPYIIMAILSYLYHAKYVQGNLNWNPGEVCKYVFLNDLYPILSNCSTFFIYYFMSSNYQLALRSLFSFPFQKPDETKDGVKK